MTKKLDRQSALEYLGLAEQASLERQGDLAADWIVYIDNEYNNLIEALEYFVDAMEPNEAQRFASSLEWYWERRGRFAEGRKWLQKTLDISDAPTSTRAATLYAAGLLAFRQGDVMASRVLNQQGLSIAQQIGNKEEAIATLMGLARVGLHNRDYQFAKARAGEILAAAHELGTKDSLVAALHILGVVGRMEREYQHAREMFEECITINSQLGNKRMVALELIHLGYIVLHEQQPQQARVHFASSLRISNSLASSDLRIYALVGLAVVATANKEWERAAKLFGATEGQLERLGIKLHPPDQPEHELYLTEASKGLGQALFDHMRILGRTMTLEEAVDYALLGI